MEQDVRSFYQEEALRIDKEKEKLGKDYNRIAWSRLIVFLAAVILLYMGLTERPGKIIYLIGGIATVYGRMEGFPGKRKQIS